MSSVVVWYPCRAINGSVQYTTSVYLPYVLLFTQALTRVWFDFTIIDINTIYPLTVLYHGTGSGYVGVWLRITHGD